MRTSSEAMPAGREAPAAAERTGETLPAGSVRGRLYQRVFESGGTRALASPRNGVAFGLYALFAVTFASFRVSNDGLVYYHFLRRFLGEGVPSGSGYAYQFGVAYFNAPFYLLARAVEEITGGSSIFGAPIHEAAIGFASNVALALTLIVGWKLLRRLELPAGPGVLLLTVFGSPLFYYTAFQPSYKHAVDALFLTLVAYLLLDVSERPSTRTALALGACLAMLVAVRYANVGLIPGALFVFVLARDWGRLRAGMVALAAVGALLFALPAARQIPFKRNIDASALVRPAEDPESRPSTRPPRARYERVTGPDPVTGVQRAATRGRPVSVVAAGLFPHISDPCPDMPKYRIDWSQCLRNKLGIRFDAGSPVRMLFSERRGLFLWTPLTAFSVLGLVLLFRARPDQRRFLASLTAAAVSLVAIHALWGDFWTNGFSFSQRFLASLFPVYLLGTAELVRRFRLRAAVVLTACALFSLFVGFNHFLGYQRISERDGLWAVMTTKGDRDVAETLRLVGTRALDRWGFR